MSDLPDIDTTEASYLAYWNAIDDGGVAPEDFNPEEVTSYGGIESTTLYDNGIEGTLSAASGDFNTTYFRVKSDGWIVVYMTREESTGTRVSDSSDIYGPWQIFGYSGAVPEQNNLAQEVGSLQNNLEATTNFQHSDVGLYNYEHPTATTLTCFAQTGTFSYTDGTTVHRGYAVAVANALDGDSWTADSHLDAENGTVTLADNNASDGTGEWSARDVLDKGDVANPSTEYTLTQNESSNFYGNNACHAHFLWE